jgi:hypothetical protein
MTAEEYLNYLITVAKSNTSTGVQAAELELLLKMMHDDRTGKYTP